MSRLTGIKNVTAKEKENILFLREKGFSVAEISNTLGRSRQAIYQVLERENQEQRKKAEGKGTVTNAPFGHASDSPNHLRRPVAELFGALVPAQETPPVDKKIVFKEILTQLMECKSLLQRILQAWEG